MVAQIGARSRRGLGTRVGTLRRLPGGLLYAVAVGALLLAFYGPFLFNERLGGFDWIKDAFYLEYLKAALSGGHLPETFVAVPSQIDWYPAFRFSRSYWANGETLALSPLMAALPFMSVPAFVKLYVAVHLAVGAAGLWVLIRRLGLGLLAAVAAATLLLLMPWLMQHLALGYLPWVTACYVPWIAAALVRDPLRVRDVALAACLNALILYEGGTHVFMWLNGGIVLLAAARALRTRRLASLAGPALVILATAVLVAPRALATLTVYDEIEGTIAGTYGSLGDLWGLVTDTHTDVFGPRSVNEGVYGTNFYDASLGLGVAWTLLIAVAVGLLCLRTRRAGSWRAIAGWDVAIAAAAFAVLGWAGVWETLAEVASPLATERYPVRFLAVAAMLLGFLAATELAALARGPARRTVAAIAVAALIAVVAVGFHGRVESFAAAGSGGAYAPLVGDVDAWLAASTSAESLDGAPVPSAASVNGFLVRAGTAPRCVRLPWLPTRRLEDFELRGATARQASPDEPAVVCAARAGSPIELAGDSHGRYPALGLSLLVFAGLLVALRRRMPA